MAANINSTNFAGSPATWIVDPVAGKGQFTTIALALAAATSGDLIYIRPGTYTENPTLKAGVDLVACGGEGTTPTVTIVGKCTLSTAGNVSINGIRLTTNSDYCVSNTSNGAIHLEDCYVYAFDDTSIQNSNASGIVYLKNCKGLIINAGDRCFDNTGVIVFYECNMGNNATTTASPTSGTLLVYNSYLSFPLSTSGTAAVQIYNSSVVSNAGGIPLNVAGTGGVYIFNSLFWNFNAGGAAMAVGAGATINIHSSIINSAAANAVTGAGTIAYSAISFPVTKTMSVTTQTPVSFAVPQGGTGVSSQAAYSLVAGGTTTTAAFQAISPVATGQVLISSGTGALPAFSAAPTVTSVTLGAGTALSTFVSGTWTPAVSFNNGTTGITYTLQSGLYTRINNTVFISCSIILSNNGSDTGGMRITGLPITVSSTGNYYSIPVTDFANITFPANFTNMIASPEASTTNLIVYRTGSAQNITVVTQGTDTVADTARITFTGFYNV